MSATSYLASVFQSLLKRRYKLPIRRRYFGIKKLTLIGGVYAEDLPTHHFTVGLLDEKGLVISTTLSNQPIERPEIPNGHGFSFLIPAHWLLPNQDVIRKVQFQIMETGEVFPNTPRLLPVDRLIKKLSNWSALESVFLRQVEEMRINLHHKQGEEPIENLVQRYRMEALCTDIVSLPESNYLIVGTHELTRTGAPLIILEIVKHLRTRYDLNIILLSLGSRHLLSDEFEPFCALIIDDLSKAFQLVPQSTEVLFSHLAKRSTNLIALINSLVSTQLVVACHNADSL